MSCKSKAKVEAQVVGVVHVVVVAAVAILSKS